MNAFLNVLASASATVADTLNSMARVGIAAECMSCRFFVDGMCMMRSGDREWPCIDSEEEDDGGD